MTIFRDSTAVCIAHKLADGTIIVDELWDDAPKESIGFLELDFETIELRISASLKVDPFNLQATWYKHFFNPAKGGTVTGRMIGIDMAKVVGKSAIEMFYDDVYENPKKQPAPNPVKPTRAYGPPRPFYDAHVNKRNWK